MIVRYVSKDFVFPTTEQYMQKNMVAYVWGRIDLENLKMNHTFSLTTQTELFTIVGMNWGRYIGIVGFMFLSFAFALTHILETFTYFSLFFVSAKPLSRPSHTIIISSCSSILPWSVSIAPIDLLPSLVLLSHRRRSHSILCSLSLPHSTCIL